MPRCNAHGMEYSAFGSCPLCATERAAHEARDAAAEAASATQRLEEEARLQHEQLMGELAVQAAESERQHEESAAIARERVVVERQRLEEDRAHRRAQEEALMLRSGLPEFAEDFRERWLAVNRDLEDLLERERRFEAEAVPLRQRRDTATRERATLLASLRSALKREFDEALAARSLDEISAPLSDRNRDHWARIGAAHAALGSVMGFEDLWRMGGTPLGDSTGRLLLSARELPGILASRASPPSWSRNLGCTTWIVAGSGYLLLLQGLATLGVYDVRQPSRNPVEGLFLLGGLLAMVFLVRFLLHAAAGYATRSGMARLPEPAARFEHAVRAWLDATCEDRGAIKRADPDQLASSPVSLLEDDHRRLYQTLSDRYYDAQAVRRPELQKAAELLGETEALESRLADLSARFGTGTAEATRTRREHEVLRQAVLSVGSAIVRGVRLPGRKIRIFVCPQCAGPATVESSSCPYCGSAFSPLDREDG